MLEEQAEAGVEYSGRKVSRRGSERRRKAILASALRIIIREGVRGIRHRAVAKEAGVPLSQGCPIRSFEPELSVK